MKKVHASLAFAAVAVMVGSVLFGGCGGACSDLEKKKSDCKGDGKELCEKIIDEAVKNGNQDACKAALDNIDKNSKK